MLLCWPFGTVVWIFLVVNSVCFSPLFSSFLNFFPPSSYIPTQRGGLGKGQHIIGNARALCWENLVHLPNDSWVRETRTDVRCRCRMERLNTVPDFSVSNKKHFFFFFSFSFRDVSCVSRSSTDGKLTRYITQTPSQSPLGENKQKKIKWNKN